MPSQPIAGILFDLDGTLIDTCPDLTAALNCALAEAGLPAVEAAALRTAVAHGSTALLRAALGERADEWAAADRLGPLREAFLVAYAALDHAAAALFPGMTELLDALEARGLRWGVVTNKHERFARRLLERLELAGRAGCIVCGDTLERAKPHPEPLWHGCALLRLPVETGCVYVGDAKNDVRAARAAGMPALVAGWGYVPAEAIVAAWQADAMLPLPKDLLIWLDRRVA